MDRREERGNRSHAFGLEGGFRGGACVERTLLFSEGSRHERNLKITRISVKDLEEAVRKELNQTSFEGVEAIYLERSGELSIIEKAVAAWQLFVKEIDEGPRGAPRVV